MHTHIGLPETMYTKSFLIFTGVLSMLCVRKFCKFTILCRIIKNKQI